MAQYLKKCKITSPLGDLQTNQLRTSPYSGLAFCSTKRSQSIFPDAGREDDLPNPAAA